MPDDKSPRSTFDRESEGSYVDPETKKKSSEEVKEDERQAAVVTEVRERLSMVEQVEDEQRKREDDDLYFEGVDQWDEVAREARAQKDEEGVTTPAKPTIEVNLLDQPLQQGLTEARNAKLAITVRPKAGLSNTKMTGYFKGLIRSIQVESGAESVRIWALERTMKAGRGAYRIDTGFANDGDFDQDIILHRILDQGTVRFDPYSQMADRSDADWVIVTNWISVEERKRRWKDKPITISADVFGDATESWYEVNEVTGLKSIQIAEYFRVKHTPKVLAHHASEGSRPLEEMPTEIQEMAKAKSPGVKTRTVDQRTVEYFVVDGHQVLEETPRDGRYLTVIETTGKEYYVKGKRIWKGIVCNAKDLSRAINVILSATVEVVGQLPRAPYIMLAGQDEGFEKMWDDAFTKTYSRLYINSQEVGGKAAPFPQRQNLEPQIQGLMFLVKMLQDMLHSVVGSVDAANRAVSPYDRSGKAIEALQRQGSAGTGNFLDNLATISMMHEGRVLVDLIPHVYDRPGRILRVMGEESNNDETAIMVKVPFIRDKHGEPIPVPCPVCQGQGTVPGSRLGQPTMPPGGPPQMGGGGAPQGGPPMAGGPAPSAPPMGGGPPMPGAEMLPPPPVQQLQNPIMQFFQPLPVTCSACRGTKKATKETMPEWYQEKEVEYVDFSEGEFKIQVVIGRSFQTKQEEAMAAMSDLAKAAPEAVPLYMDLWVEAMGFPGSKGIAERLKARTQPQGPEGQEEDTEGVPPGFLAKYQKLQMEHKQLMQAMQEATKAIETDKIKAMGQTEIAQLKAASAQAIEEIKQQGKSQEAMQQTQAKTEVSQMQAQIETMQKEAQRKHEQLLAALEQRGAALAAETKAASALEIQDAKGQDALELERVRQEGAEKLELLDQAGEAKSDARTAKMTPSEPTKE